MTTEFYNKVAKKFGNYHTDAKYFQKFQKDDPEEVFKEKLIEFSGKDKLALDIGCADGRFTLSVAPYFQKVIAIDSSVGMINAAKNNQQKQRIKNVSFEIRDASKTNLPDSTFDLLYCRRGPTFYNEYQRLLKKDGFYVEIGIGEKDVVDLKKIFGRGQDFGGWDNSRIDKDKQELESNGFKIVFARDYFYGEYYASSQDLDLFLQGVPIFEDYDSKKDNKYLSKYIKEFKTNKGIKLCRHRLVIVAKKI